VGLVVGTPPLAAPLPPPPLPELPPSGATRAPAPATGSAAEASGTVVMINGQPQKAQWHWIGPAEAPPAQLWLPLEVLQGQLGVSSGSRGGRGELALDWFGRRLLVPAGRQRSLGDEVAIDLVPLLESTGLEARRSGSRLSLRLAPPLLLGVRPSAAPPGQRRVVLDLGGPAVVRSSEASLEVDLGSRAEQRTSLASLGLLSRQQGSTLVITPASGGGPVRVLTLGDPHRLVIDLKGEPIPTVQAPAVTPRLDPRLEGRLGRQIHWDRLVREVAGRRVRINAVRIDPTATDLELRPLARDDGMEGLSSLVGLARRQDALVAINGGFFNRIRRLPLGALRERGRWLSGPILNRGAVGWDRHGVPRFDRLRLEEAVRDSRGTRWPLVAVNSGWLQRGLSRYSSDWGPQYHSLSDGETGALVRLGVVQRLLGPGELAGGIPLVSGEMLLVARSGFSLPWLEGESLRLESRPSTAVGLAANVVGGGPLLLRDGQSVLDGTAEGFSAAFLSQGAPRTVVGTDGRLLWLITLEGVEDGGPTLEETTQLLRGLGLRDALNLDGGSSTGLVMGGLHTVKGRGVAGAVHNGLGLVPAAAGPTATTPGP
jgi:hypothetical protein